MFQNVEGSNDPNVFGAGVGWAIKGVAMLMHMGYCNPAGTCDAHPCGLVRLEPAHVTLRNVKPGHAHAHGGVAMHMGYCNPAGTCSCTSDVT